MCGLTFELTGPLRWDGLARAGKMYRVPQTGPRRPAVAGPVVQRGVRPRRYLEKGLVHNCCSQGTPSPSPSILTPGQLAKKYLASRHERICEQC